MDKETEIEVIKIEGKRTKGKEKARDRKECMENGENKTRFYDGVTAPPKGLDVLQRFLLLLCKIAWMQLFSKPFLKIYHVCLCTDEA